jgi:hypothetical protein
MGTFEHLRGVSTTASMFKTAHRVSFCDSLVGSPPNRTFTILFGSGKSSLPSSTFFYPLLS